MTDILFVLYFIFGACIGSFLNVVMLRLPTDQSLGGRSHCTSCQHILGIWDLVPVFSFLFLKGRCRYCKQGISWRYALIESVTGLLFVLAAVYLHPQNLSGFLLLLKYWLALASLLAVFVIDFEYYLILDTVVFPASVIILCLNLFLDISQHQIFWHLNSNFISGLLAATGFSALFFAMWYFSGGRILGFGDVKLAILLGLILGWPQVLVGFMVGVLLGGLASIFLLVLTPKTLKSQVPFGTFLTLGTLLAMFYGHFLLTWYLSLLGF